jgi:hypothetical protein
MKLRNLVLGCAVGVAFWGSADAQAALVLNLNNGAIVVNDNAPGLDSDPAVGSITNTSTVGGFGIAISIANSDSPGTPSSATLQISSLEIKNQGVGAGVLTIAVSDNNFTLPGGLGDAMTMYSDFGGTFSINAALGNSVSFQSFVDPANITPANAVSTAPLNFVKTSSGTQAFSGSNSAPWVHGAGAYSLRNVATVSLSTGGQLNISGTTTVVPEPTFVALGALSTAVLGLRRRRA